MSGGVTSFMLAGLGGALGACAAYGALRLTRGDVARTWFLLRRCALDARRALEPAVRGLRAVLPCEGGSAGAVELPQVAEMIDVVRLGLAAGLSFDAALELYCSQVETPLASIMREAELSWRIGLATREEALLAAAGQSGVRALESIAISISQALAMGAPLADTLAVQSREIRAAHRAEIERRIERAPVKLVIPTGTLILPALLLSILGPLLAASGML